MYEELIKKLRNYAAFTAIPPFSVDLSEAADAMEKLSNERTMSTVDYCAKRNLVLITREFFEQLKASYGKPPLDEEAVTVEGYPVKELMAFAMLCRRHEITENDLHDFCTNAVRGFNAGVHDFRVAYEKAMSELEIPDNAIKWSPLPEPPKEETE